MVDIKSEHLLAFISSQVSALDGIQYKTQLAAQSAFLGTFADDMFKNYSKIDSPSATLVSGATSDDVALGLPSTIGASAIHGKVQGHPFTIATVGLSGTLTSAANTTSNTVRKVLCVVSFEDLPPVSSLAVPTGLEFVYGSEMETAIADAASTGGVTGESGIYNAVPVPKAGPKQVAVGILHIPNSYVSADGITLTMMHPDYRQMQGYDFDIIFDDLVQP